MSVGIIVLHSTDSGAPVLNGVNGTLCAVLDWALAQKGWTTLFTSSSPNARVYKQAGGLGNSLYVAHDSTISGLAYRATVRGCEGATSISALTNPFPTVAQVPNATQVVATSSSAVATARPYVIYLTDRYIKMVTDSFGTATNYNIWHFGDGVATTAGDAYFTMMSSTVTASQPADLEQNSSGGTPVHYFDRDITGTIFSSYGMPATRATVPGEFTKGVAARAGYQNRILRQKWGLDCYGSISATVGPTALPCRIFAPNLWEPLHNGYGALNQGDTFADSAYNASASFRMYGFSSANGWTIHEETDTWNAPSG